MIIIDDAVGRSVGRSAFAFIFKTDDGASIVIGGGGMIIFKTFLKKKRAWSYLGGSWFRPFQLLFIEQRAVSPLLFHFISFYFMLYRGKRGRNIIDVILSPFLLFASVK